MKKLIRTICETVLSWLGPDESMLAERPLHVDWDPAVPRLCDHCYWTWLTYQPNVWFCRNCGWLAISTWNTPPTTDPLAEALEVTEPRQKAIAAPRHTGKLATGDLVRKVHAGEISFHGEVRFNGLNRLHWEDAGERFDTGQLPAIPSWRYPDIR